MVYPKVYFFLIFAFLRIFRYTENTLIVGGIRKMTINDDTNSQKISVQRRNLISLPKQIRERLHIEEGDILDVRVEGNKIIMEPYKLVPASQAFFWTKKTQTDMSEAQQDVVSNRVREFSNVEEFLKGLDHDS